MRSNPDPIDIFTRNQIQEAIRTEGDYELYLVVSEAEGYCFILQGEETTFFKVEQGKKEMEIREKARTAEPIEIHIQRLAEIPQETVPFQLDGIYGMLWKNKKEVFRINLSVQEMKDTCSQIFQVLDLPLPWRLDE